MLKFLIFIISITLISTSTNAAQDPDLNKAIQLSGDFVQININSASGHYTGHFSATQGSMQLTGEEIQVLQDNKKQLISIISLGKPLKFKKKIYRTNETIQASATKIIYDAQNSSMTLDGNARLSSDSGKKIKSAKIIFDLISSDFQAIGNDKQRVEITIQPNTLGQSQSLLSPSKN